MARAFNGTSDLMSSDYNFSAVGIIPATQAVAISAWLYRVDNAAGKMLLEFGNTANVAGFDVQQNAFAGPADLIRSFWPPNFSWADSYPSPATGGWHHHLWFIPSGGQYGGNTVYIDGTLQALTNQGHTAGGPANYGGFTDKLTFGGRLASGVGSLWASVRLAEIGLWTFTGPSLVKNVLTLVDGRPPTFAYDEGLPTYYPLLGDNPEANHGSGPETMTLTGTSYLKHPPVDSLFMGVRGARLH